MTKTPPRHGEVASRSDDGGAAVADGGACGKDIRPLRGGPFTAFSLPHTGDELLTHRSSVNRNRSLIRRLKKLPFEIALRIPCAMRSGTSW